MAEKSMGQQHQDKDIMALESGLQLIQIFKNACESEFIQFPSSRDEDAETSLAKMEAVIKELRKIQSSIPKYKIQVQGAIEERKVLKIQLKECQSLQESLLEMQAQFEGEKTVRLNLERSNDKFQRKWVEEKEIRVGMEINNEVLTQMLDEEKEKRVKAESDLKNVEMETRKNLTEMLGENKSLQEKLKYLKCENDKKEKRMQELQSKNEKLEHIVNEEREKRLKGQSEFLTDMIREIHHHNHNISFAELTKTDVFPSSTPLPSTSAVATKLDDYDEREKHAEEESDDDEDDHDKQHYSISRKRKKMYSVLLPQQSSTVSDGGSSSEPLNLTTNSGTESSPFVKKKVRNVQKVGGKKQEHYGNGYSTMITRKIHLAYLKQQNLCFSSSRYKRRLNKFFCMRNVGKLRSPKPLPTVTTGTVDTSSDEPQFHCSHCQKIFKSKYGLHQHLKMMNPSKKHKFRCDQCPKIFTNRKSLIRHKAIHTGGNLFFCSPCKREFNRKDSIIAHMRNVHNNQWTQQPVKDSHTKNGQRDVVEQNTTGRGILVPSSCDCDPFELSSLLRHSVLVLNDIWRDDNH